MLTVSRPHWPSAVTQQAFFKRVLTEPSPRGGSQLSNADVTGFFHALLRSSGEQSVNLEKSRRSDARVASGLVEQGAQVPAIRRAAPDKGAAIAEAARRGRQERQSWSVRLSQGLSKTRSRLVSQLSGLLSAGVKVDEELLEDIESELLAADVGIDATDRILSRLREQAKQSSTVEAEALYQTLEGEMERILAVPGDNPFLHAHLPLKPFVLMVVGVNGVGKTTTIGKIAKHQTDMGRSVMLAAGDTFRAAAVEQLKTWGERLGVPVIAQQTGADSASVVFDAYNAAKARGVDLLIADTAGRLHTKDHLMDELKKVQRVVKKIDPQAPHAIMLVLDAGNGQNALNQARVFHEAVNVSGIALTKLDGTARGGISFAICETLRLPLWFIGVGEQADDLRPFNATDFVQALLKR